MSTTVAKGTEDDFLTRLQQDIARRLHELEPLVDEAADLEAALAELERDSGRGDDGRPPAPPSGD